MLTQWFVIVCKETHLVVPNPAVALSCNRARGIRPV